MIGGGTMEAPSAVAAAAAVDAVCSPSLFNSDFRAANMLVGKKWIWDWIYMSFHSCLSNVQ